jgi:uncharacterized SAM-binding protein YcdF (DUF218 family)
MEEHRFDLPYKPGQSSRWLWISAFLLFFACFAAYAFLDVGKWLVVQDPLQNAQAIVVLSGGLPVRALEAAQIYHQGYAQEIWLTVPVEPRASLAAMGIPYEGEETYSRRILEHEGVPPGSIRALSPPILNTADEIRAVDSELQSAGGKTVIIVTSKAHTRRVHALWKKLVKGRYQAIIRPAAGDSFDAAHWWRNTHDALDVVREVLGLLNVWAGLPLRPATLASAFCFPLEEKEPLSPGSLLHDFRNIGKLPPFKRCQRILHEKRLGNLSPKILSNDVVGRP